MFDQALLVKYITLKSCFIYLPSNIQKSTAGSCIKLTYDKGKTAYFSLGASNTTIVDGNYVAINSLYAKSLGILENDLVNVCEINALPSVKSLTITPLTNEDYEVLEMFADNVQSTLLEQIRVVYSNQRMIIWIGTNINVTVFVGDVKPVSPGVLDFLTEVVIKTPDESFKRVSEGNYIIKKFNESHTNCPSNFQELFAGTKLYKNQYKNCTLTPKTIYSLPEEIFRMVDTELWPQLQKYNEVFNAFTFKKFAKQTWQCTNSLDTPIFCSVKLLSSIWDREVFVRLFFIEDILNSSNDAHYNIIFVHSKVLNYFVCDVGTRVNLREITETPNVKEIKIYTKKVNLVNVKEIVKYLLKHKTSPFIINSDFVLKMPDDINFSLKYLPDNPKYCIFDRDFIKRCTFLLYEDSQMISEEIKVVDEVPAFKDIRNFQTVINDVKAKFLYNQLENIIITGRPGCGKTTLLQTINSVLKNYPYLIYTEIIQCKQLKGKTLDSLQKVLNKTFSKLLRSQPSALLLDDVHVLCETVTGEENANTVYINRVSEMVYNLLKMLSEINDVAIIFTSEATSKLNENIYMARGDHLFKNVYTIEDLNKYDRQNMLRYLFEKHVYDEINFEDLSLKMDGFVIQDIINFYNKALFEAYKEEGISDNNLVIHEEHCIRALENTVALSLENVQLYLPGDKTLSDVGGLSKVKNTLTESLLWPAQYSSIFANAPLRLQSGILLYGPPGTGKTLLAGAAARHCKLRLIAVKGPELLSKYIGASEQGVRDIFEKAKSARPCILFFDEFDSLAPRRGHDNTGVTDRVVNQLLTQLDGVESLVGVCVLAATSRPDLLDPALLRPGRLDKQLFCPLPNMQDRLEILRTCSKDLDLAPNTKLEHIAMLTNNYSGADLQSILSTARLSSLELLLKKGNINDTKQIEITQQLLLESLKTTRPSLTKSERQKYELIYRKFQGKIPGDFKVGTKATFA